MGEEREGREGKEGWKKERPARSHVSHPMRGGAGGSGGRSPLGNENLDLRVACAPVGIPTTPPSPARSTRSPLTRSPSHPLTHTSPLAYHG